MSWVAAAIIGGSSLVSGYMGSKAAKDAARMQARGADRAMQMQREMYDISREDLRPYREMGYGALSDITAMKPFLTGQFEDYREQYLDPSMAFRMKYGTQAAERLGNVAGGAISGNTLKGLQEFGQGLASTEYANAFNRFQTERGNIYNTLSNIAGMGQGAVNTGVQAGQAYAQDMTGLITGQAAARAAGTVGSANAWSQALQGPSNYLQLSALMGRNPFGGFGGGGGMGAPTSAGMPYTGNLA